MDSSIEYKQKTLYSFQFNNIIEYFFIRCFVYIFVDVFIVAGYGTHKLVASIHSVRCCWILWYSLCLDCRPESEPEKNSKVFQSNIMFVITFYF